MEKEKKTKGLFKGKLLGKPKIGIEGHSAEKVIQQASRGNIALVRQVEPKQRVEDHRSLYFKDEVEKENKSGRSWLFKD